ncbi:MAG: ribulose-phosphate 3-epimerase [Bacteroidetes bacterium 43-93]|nr:ribulose-phosphate 3-epimerase [Bacteroidota bacterium]OJW99999.1 MAG: ribulose-phosphate 3-epimerase [Bacteroidetes bacterium 43-93]
MPLIAPSMLSADFLNLGRDIEMVNNSEADWFHLDVMDGRFVPNISYGMPIIAQMKKLGKKTFDVHLMIEDPERYLEDFKKAGADYLTVHYETGYHIHRTLTSIKALGMKAGLSINPHTPVSMVQDIIGEIDLLLIMSINPGFGGQKFLPLTYKKIREAKDLINTAKAGTLIEIDGGVTLENAADIVAAGADVLVAGNTVFSAPDPAAMIKKLKEAIK